MRNVQLGVHDNKKTLLEFYKWKNKFTFIQRLSLFVSFILVLVCPFAINKILFGIDIVLSNQILYLPQLFSGLIAIFIIGVILHFTYGKKLTSAENLLKDLEED